MGLHCSLLDCVQETVVLWEQLRPKQTTKEEREQLVATILKKVRVFLRSSCPSRLVVR
jgi:hypothetical protein